MLFLVARFHASVVVVLGQLTIAPREKRGEVLEKWVSIRGATRQGDNGHSKARHVHIRRIVGEKARQRTKQVGDIDSSVGT